MARINVYDYTPVEYGGAPEFAGHFMRGSSTQYKEDGDWDDTATHEELYRTKGGRWVRCDWTQWQGSEPKYWFVSSAEAKEWLLKNHHDDAVRRWFGPVEEEIGPTDLGGRREVGPKVEVRLDKDTLAQVEARATAAGISRAEMLRRLVVAGLDAGLDAA